MPQHLLLLEFLHCFTDFHTIDRDVLALSVFHYVVNNLLTSRAFFLHTLKMIVHIISIDFDYTLSKAHSKIYALSV